MVLAIWLSSGTMAPYAATLNHPLVLRCDYLANIDHGHFRAAYSMLEGAPRSEWEFSVVLRRIVYPLLAFPFMRIFGFFGGGVVASLLLHIVALIAFVHALRARLGEPAALLGAWLLAVYPGITYWAALPYSYVTIVPGTLVCMIILWRLDSATSPRRAAWLGAALSVVFFAYDLLPFFGPPAVLLLAMERRWRALAALTAGLAATLATISLVLLAALGPSAFVNSNTSSYARVLRSYLSAPDFTAWWELIKQLPGFTVETALFSNFLFLPGACALVALLRAASRAHPPLLGRAEWSLMAATVFLYLFNNLAPPYPGWQMRGVWIPRLYQPLFGVYLVYLCGAFGHALADGLRWRRGMVLAVCALTLAGHAAVVLGPVTRSEWAIGLYARFYKHARPTAMLANLDRHGRRPLGFCRRDPAR